MTTGSINYSPDYKSEERNPLNVIFQQGMERQRLSAERSRLEREVIEAAKKWSPKRGHHATHHTARQCPTCAAERMFHNAVANLIDFESSQLQKGSQ